MNESILKSIENIFLWSTYHKQDLFFKVAGKILLEQYGSEYIDSYNDRIYFFNLKDSIHSINFFSTAEVLEFIQTICSLEELVKKHFPNQSIEHIKNLKNLVAYYLCTLIIYHQLILKNDNDFPTSPDDFELKKDFSSKHFNACINKPIPNTDEGKKKTKKNESTIGSLLSAQQLDSLKKIFSDYESHKYSGKELKNFKLRIIKLFTIKIDLLTSVFLNTVEFCQNKIFPTPSLTLSTSTLSKNDSLDKLHSREWEEQDLEENGPYSDNVATAINLFKEKYNEKDPLSEALKSTKNILNKSKTSYESSSEIESVDETETPAQVSKATTRVTRSSIQKSHSIEPLTVKLRSQKTKETPSPRRTRSSDYSKGVKVEFDDIPTDDEILPPKKRKTSESKALNILKKVSLEDTNKPLPLLNKTSPPVVQHVGRKKWTLEEEEAFKQGIIKYGSGNWSKILEDPTFGEILKNRNNINLKDKYRNFLSSGELVLK